MRGKFGRIWPMATELLAFRMERFSKGVLVKGSHLMEFLYLASPVIMSEILINFRLLARASMKILKMGTTMKANGKRTYNMVKESKNIQTKMNIQVVSCAAVNSEKANTNSQMEESTKDHFIMGIVMVTGNSI